MVADVDRMIVGERAGLECKTASAYSAGKWKDGQIPPHYLIQCVHYMAVTNADCWYLAVVILGQGFQWMKIERDEELIQNLIQIEQNFWENHVQAGRTAGGRRIGGVYRVAESAFPYGKKGHGDSAFRFPDGFKTPPGDCGADKSTRTREEPDRTDHQKRNGRIRVGDRRGLPDSLEQRGEYQN